MCTLVMLYWPGFSLSERPTGFLQCFDTVGLVIRPVEIVPDMTYNVFGGTLVNQCVFWMNLCLCHTCIVSLSDLMNAHVTLAGFLGRSVCILPRCQWWAVDAANEGDWQANIQSSVLATLHIYLSDSLSACLSVSLFVCMSLCVSIFLSICNWNIKLANVIVCFLILSLRYCEGVSFE